MKTGAEKKNRARKSRRAKTKKGFTLIEVLVAALLLSIAILTASLMRVSSVESVMKSARLKRASILLENKLDEMLSFSKADFLSGTTGFDSLWVLNEAGVDTVFQDTIENVERFVTIDSLVGDQSAVGAYLSVTAYCLWNEHGTQRRLVGRTHLTRY
jgi:prepilin-type N-terminal cleavage/methylation domain-containing protein